MLNTNSFTDQAQLSAQLVIRHQFNHMPQPYDQRPLYQQFVTRLDQPGQADQVAVIAGDGQLSYGDLYQQSSRLGGYLSQAVGASSKPAIVAILLPKSQLQAVSVWGALAAGAAYLPLDCDQPQARLHAILEDAQPDVIIVNEQTEGLLAGHSSGSVLNLSQRAKVLFAGAVPAPQSLPGYHTKLDDLAYVIYTSGTTGQPKGVMIEWRGVLNAIDYSLKHLFTASERLVMLGVSALHHDMSVFDVLGVMVSGGVLVLPAEGDRKNPEAWAQLMHQYDVNGWVSVPAMMEMLLTWGEYKQYCFGHLRTVLLGGDWLPLPLADRIRALSSEETVVYSVGGPTETTMWNIAHKIEGIEAGWSSVPYGRPIANCGYHILDESLSDVPDWVVSELYCSGVSLARGYLNDAERTAERFITHPVSQERLYRTGDLGFYHPDGRIEFVGRADGQLKVRGNRVEAGEVRAHLEGWPEVSRAVVYLSEQQQLVAALLLSPGVVQLEQEQLYARAKAVLSEAMIPSVWLQLTEFPLTSNGKVDMKALLALAAQPADQGPRELQAEGSDRALNEVESKLARLWSALLGQGPEHSGDNFFALGGDSLLLIRLLSRIQSEFQVSVTLPDLLTHLKLWEQAELIASKNNASSVSHQSLSVARHQRIPLSSSQRGFWFQMTLDKASDRAKYNIPLSFEIRGFLAPSKFKRALHNLIQRHRLLNSRIVTTDAGEPCLQMDAYDIELRFSDWSDFSPAEQQQKIHMDYLTGCARELDVYKDPLFHAHLIKLSEESHYLHLLVHHIVFDGVSCDVLVRELLTLYHDKSLPELSFDYIDYIQWERSPEQQESLQSGMAYWQQRLQDMEPLVLPYAAAESDDTTNGTMFRQIEKADVDALRAFARQHQTTLFTAFSVALQLVLSRFKTEGDVTFGTYVSNRVNSDFEKSVGNFINLLTLRFDFNVHATLSEAMQCSHQQIVADFAWQHVPFEAVVEACNPVRTVGQHPFFDVALIFNDGVLEKTYEEDGLTLSLKTGGDFGMGSHRTAIEFWLYPTNEGLLCEVNYAKHQVGDHLVAMMLEGFKHVLTMMVRAKDQTLLSQLPLYPANKAMSTLAGTLDPFENLPISELLDRQVKAQPNQIIFTDQGVNYTYLDLWQRSQVLAAALQSKGVKQTDRVGILLPYGVSMVIASLAVLRLGGTLLLLDTIDTPERINELTKRAQVVLVVTNDEFVVNVPNQQPFFSLSLFNFLSSTEPVPSAETEVVYLVYTSGSTGASKAIEGRRFGLLNRIYWGERAYPSDQTDVFVLKTSVSFVDIYAELFMPIVIGRRAVIAKDDVRKDPIALVEYVRAQQATRITLTPTLLSEMCAELERREDALTSLTHIIVSGELLFSQLTERARLCMPQAKIINIYGSSEMSADIIAYEVKGSENGLIPAGTLLSHAAARIVNPDGWILPRGCVGELCCGGPVLAHGYALAQPEQETKFFREQGQYWFKTGDFGLINEAGQMVVLGRRDDQIKIRGVRIDLRAIDRIVCDCAGVLAACSATVLAHNGDLVLGVLVVASQGIDQTQIYEELQRVLPRSSMPSIIMLIPDIPKLRGGKVDRRAVAMLLAENYLLVRGEQADVVLPRNDIEQKIAQLWRTLLGTDGNIDIHQNFFMLGGHSVLATRLLNSLKSEFNVDLSLVDVFHAPTIAQQSELIQTLPMVQEQSWPIADRAIHHSLSENQLGAWYTSKTSKQHSLSNHLGLMYSIDGILDAQQLQQALNQLVMRHEALRTAFDIVGNAPAKLIHPFGVIGLTYRMCDDTVADSLVEYNRLMSEPFDLSCPPLMKMMLLTPKMGGKQGRAKSILILVAHHIIVDAWSLQVFFRDLNRLYHGEVLEPLLHQGIDYEYFKRNDPALLVQIDKAAAFWKQHLKDMPHCLNLPLDYPRSEGRTLSGRTLCMDVPDTLLEAVRLLAIKHQVGGYHVLMSAFMMTLSLWCNERDIVIGGGVSGRDQGALDEVVDFFSDVVLFRAQLSEQGSLSEHLERLLTTVSQSLAHQPYSFTQITQQVNHPRSALYHPVVQVICTHQNLVEDLVFDETSLSLFMHPEQTQKTVRFDLNLFLFEHNQHMKLVIDYADELFDEFSINVLLKAYIQMLQNLVTMPELALNKLSLFTSEPAQNRAQYALRDEGGLVQPPVVARGAEHLNQVSNRAVMDKKMLRQVLSDGMEEVLGRVVRTDVSMFEQGGNSMNIIAYQIYIHKALAFDIDIGILIGYPTIDLLVDYLFETLAGDQA
ncbi:amino acid adenylation domain-containing protein [Neisseriaceae bacterium CLB008]